MSFPRRRLRTSAVGLLTALLIAAASACGDDDSDAGTATAGNSEQQSASTAPAAQDPFEHLRVLADDIGPRPAGSDAERRAAEYLRDEYASAGYETELQTFTFSAPPSALVASPSGAIAFTTAFSGSPSGDVTGPLVYVGLARPADVPAAGLSGAIALAERGEIFFQDKAANVAAAGARALIVINNEAGPLGGEVESSPIPVVGAPDSERDHLLALAEAGDTVHVVLEPADTMTSQNVVARPPDGRCVVVVGAHYDSVPQGPGANDNASGAGVALAIAEERAERGDLDGACYISFGAEEVGLHGSQHFVQALTAAQLAGLRAMLNLDMVGAGGSWRLIGSPEYQELGQRLAGELGIAAEPWELPPQFGSDHQPFVDAGVSSLFLHRFEDPNYHTPHDTSQAVDPGLLGEALALGHAFVAEVLTEAPVLASR